MKFFTNLSNYEYNYNKTCLTDIGVNWPNFVHTRPVKDFRLTWQALNILIIAPETHFNRNLS